LSNTATMRVSNDQDEITSEIEIAVPRERVFQALVDPQQVLLWWGQTGIYRCTEFQSELRPVVNGAAQESVPRAAHFKSPANISKSLLRVFSSIPGLPVGLETRKQPYAGSCIQLRPEPCFASGTAVLLPIQELATATAAGHACLDGFKLSLKRGRLCSTGKHRRFDVPAYKWPMVSNSNSLTTDH